MVNADVESVLKAFLKESEGQLNFYTTVPRTNAIVMLPYDIFLVNIW